MFKINNFKNIKHIILRNNYNITLNERKYLCKSFSQNNIHNNKINRHSNDINNIKDNVISIEKHLNDKLQSKAKESSFCFSDLYDRNNNKIINNNTFNSYKQSDIDLYNKTIKYILLKDNKIFFIISYAFPNYVNQFTNNFIEKAKDSANMDIKFLSNEKNKNKYNENIELSIKKEYLNNLIFNLKKDAKEITKIKLSFLNSLVAITTYLLYSTTLTPFTSIVFFSLGTTCMSMTTQVLNQIIEKKFDSKMKRTLNRPMPKNKFANKEAYLIALLLYSISVLSYSLNPYFLSTLSFSTMILLIYIFVYTPLKRINNLSMHIGGIVGALPAILGSVAALNSVFMADSLLLAGYILCWQYPHFYGILFPNREDYKKAGFKFIAVDESKDSLAQKHIVLGMIGMFIIVYEMYRRKLINKYIYLTFLISFLYKTPPIVKFTSNPIANGKLIRVRSYIPFMIVLLSYLYIGTKNKINNIKN